MFVSVSICDNERSFHYHVNVRKVTSARVGSQAGRHTGWLSVGHEAVVV